MMKRHFFWIVVFLLSTTLLRAADAGTPLPVRHSEGLVHGFLVLRSMEDEIVAFGDLFQFTQKNATTAHLVFHFKDGSLHDETVTYSQNRVFRLLRYKLVQKGPSFPMQLDVSMDAVNNQVTVHSTQDGKDKDESSRDHLPTTISNGMLSILVKNLAPQAGETKLSMVAFTPKPQVVALAFSPQGEDSFSIGGVSRKATRYNMKIEIGGIKGVIAPLVGKQPPDTQLWVLGGETPAFLMSQGPLFYGGPIWRIELSSPTYPKEMKKSESDDAHPK
ncbi:MAG TPA: hypothetical protein VGK22_17760 [Candidatus Angelobacter sp.]|jgi:hypothetical protein